MKCHGAMASLARRMPVLTTHTQKTRPKKRKQTAADKRAEADRRFEAARKRWLSNENNQKLLRELAKR